MKEIYDINDVMRRFGTYLMMERGLSRNTVEAYTDDVQKLLTYLHDDRRSPADATEDDLHNFLSGLHDVGISPRSQARILSGIKTFYKYLKIDGYIEHNPTLLIESPRLGRELPSVLTVEEIDEIIAVAEDIIADRKKYAHACDGKKIATLFFEPSTRTRLSFEAAMIELGGSALGFASASNSSTTKGESVMDTIRTVGAYADIIAMRHPLEGAALAASQRSIVPVVNAGDGGHCHPTQTLADLLTIKNRHGRLDHLTIGICGDLKYGRTVHSLINALTRYEGNRFVMISPPELTIPTYVRYEIMEPRKAIWSESTNIEDCIADLDVLYMTRIQRERFSDMDEYERFKDCYVLNAEKLKAAKPDMSVLHPLPRVKEINVDMDDDPRACYFKQVEYGKFMRMALILKLLDDAEKGYCPEQNARELVEKGFVCQNPKCVTAVESDLKQMFSLRDAEHQVYRCEYCETRWGHKK